MIAFRLYTKNRSAVMRAFKNHISCHFIVFSE